MFSGRTQGEKDRLAATITEDVSKILNVEGKEVVVLSKERRHGNWYADGKHL
jgi:phenylpyruvate tautomerase PptA (4-oxalocrotonate tautomerase family)